MTIRLLAQFATLAVLLTATLYAFATVYDIRDFGAKCDGVTDDGPAVQAAIEKSGPGDTVLVSGMCGLGSDVRISGKTRFTLAGKKPGDGFKVLAAGQQAIVAFSAVLIKVDDCSDSVIEKLEFNGNDICTSVVGVTGCRRVTVRDLNIYDVASNGKASGVLTASGNHHNTYTRITINTPHVVPGGDEIRGMWIGNWWEVSAEWYPTISYNTIRYVPATGIATHCVAPVFSHNVVEHTGGAGIKTVACLDEKTKVQFPGLTVVEHNVLNFNKFQGYQNESTSNVLVKDNWIEGNVMTGMYVTGPVRDLVITGNIFINNQSSGSSGGLWIHGLSIAEISDNTFVETREGQARQQVHGLGFIPIHTEINNVRVQNNLFEGHLQSGIVMQKQRFPYTNLLLKGNVFRGNEGVGCEAQGIDAGTVTVAGNLYQNNLAGTSTGLLETEDQATLAPPMPLEALGSLVDGKLNYRLAWDNVPEADAYIVEVSRDRFVDETITYAGITQLGYTLTDLPRGATYYWRVRAVCGARQSPWSAPRLFTTGPVK